jgi:hypothetical protein
MSVLDLPPLECPTRCNNSGDAAGRGALVWVANASAKSPYHQHVLAH